MIPACAGMTEGERHALSLAGLIAITCSLRAAKEPHRCTRGAAEGCGRQFRSIRCDGYERQAGRRLHRYVTQVLDNFKTPPTAPATDRHGRLRKTEATCTQSSMLTASTRRRRAVWSRKSPTCTALDGRSRDRSTRHRAVAAFPLAHRCGEGQGRLMGSSARSIIRRRSAYRSTPIGGSDRYTVWISQAGSHADRDSIQKVKVRRYRGPMPRTCPIFELIGTRIRRLRQQVIGIENKSRPGVGAGAPAQSCQVSIRWTLRD